MTEEHMFTASSLWEISAELMATSERIGSPATRDFLRGLATTLRDEAKRIDWLYTERVDNAVMDTLVVLANDRGYLSGEEDGKPYPEDEDVARVLAEPTLLAPVLAAILERLGVPVPEAITRALPGQEPPPAA